VRKLFSGKPRRDGAKKRTRTPAAAESAPDVGDVASVAEDALQSLRELEELVVGPAASAKTRKRRWSLFGGGKAKATAGPSRAPAQGTTPTTQSVESAAHPEREQLIRDALAIQRDKQSALASLSDEQRALLREMAQKLLGADPGKGGA